MHNTHYVNNFYSGLFAIYLTASMIPVFWLKNNLQFYVSNRDGDIEAKVDFILFKII